MNLDSVNPATGERVQSYPEDTDAQISTKLEAAARAAREWRLLPFATRATLLRRVATLLRERREIHARLMAVEMGKPLRQGLAESDKCAAACDHFAAHAEAALHDEPVPTEALRSVVTFQPLGTILAVMPWNFPFWQVIRCAAPALMAGNTVVLKHASNVTGCALALGDLWADAGAPQGVFTVLLARSSRIGPVIDHPAIRAVALTGSSAAGRSVAARAGAALKKTVLELGGSDPYLILADADPAWAASVGAQSRLINSGQSCIAAKRFIPVPETCEPFQKHLADHLAAARVGDPLDPATDIGPLARPDLRDELHQQVVRSVNAGARCILGGTVPAQGGAWYPPTLLAGVRPGMSAADEETFGPVAAVLPARDAADAVDLANRSAFGLGAAVFTRDLGRGMELAARDLEAGACFVNSFVRSDARLPFGGIKDSGYGRELGWVGIREFVNIKTVYAVAHP